MQKAELVLSMPRRSSTKNREFVFDRRTETSSTPTFLFLLTTTSTARKEI